MRSDADVRGVFGPWGNGLGEAGVARRTRVLESSDPRLDRDWDAQDSWLTHVQAPDRDLRRLPADKGRVRSGHAGGDASQRRWQSPEHRLHRGLRKLETLAVPFSAAPESADIRWLFIQACIYLEIEFLYTK